MTIIPNAVDIEQFTLSGNPDTQLRRTLGLEDCVVLGFIGSFYVYEGLMLLLEAFPTMLKQIPKLRLLLVGGGPQEQVLKQRTSERGMSEVVIFAGRVPNSEVARYYDLIDLLVYPRLSTRLTNLVTPLKPLEAMAQGRLVLASDVGGHRELIRDWETGVLFKANDVDDLSDKVLTLLATPSAGDKLKTNARRYVELERNWTRSVANYQNAYAASANVRLLYAS
jgi:glycogen synthase